MSFHSFSKPADYVPLFPTTRSYAYRDSDLVAGNVTLWSSYLGLVREKGLYREDSPTAYNFGAGSIGGGGYRMPDVSPFNPSNSQLQAVDWGVINGQIYQAVSNRVGQWMMATNGYTTNDISVRVKTNVNPPFATGLAGIQNHGQANQGLITFLHAPTQRIRVAKLYDAFASTVYFTGTTPFALDTFHTLRTVQVGEILSIYLNGVLEGTVDLTNIKLGSSDTSGSPISSSPGIGLVTDTNLSRFTDFYVAPQSALPVATNITVRNYDGDIVYATTFAALADPTVVTIPDSALKQRNNLGPYGWYRVYVTGPDRGDGAWGTSYGDCTFARLPASNLPNHGILHQLGTGLDRIDEIGEGEWGLGSSRYSIFNVTSPASTIVAERTQSLNLAKTWVVDTASAARPRKLVMAWSGGSLGHEATVTSVVSSLQNLVKVWESRNEPNFGDGPDHWTTTEFFPFADAVHAGDPTAIVIGPGSVSFNDWGSIFFFERFLAAGGGAKADAFSFHPYNCYQGDLAMMRYSLGKVMTLMTNAGYPNYDMYMTEQGFAWMYAGVVWPHYSGRWNALMYFGQSCITHDKMRPETTCYWYDGYDNNVGGTVYDAFPTSWHSATGPGPQVGPVRTMSAEIFGKTFTSELDFGAYGKDLYVGAIWTDGSNGNKVLGIQAASYGAYPVRFHVTGATTFTLVDAWGNTSTLAASGGDITLSAHELPQWIRLPAGTTATLEPTDWNWGPNYCLGGTVATSATQNIQHLNYVNDDIQNNGYVRGFNEDVMQIGVFGGLSAPFPTTVDVTFPAQTVNRLLVHALPPWQRYGTLTDFDLQTFNGTTWTTVRTWTSDLSRSFYFTSGAPRARIETYWQDQYIFDHRFTTPVTIQGVRCLVRNTSYGAFDTAATSEPSWGSNGQGGGGYLIHIREMQAFNVTGAPIPQWPDDTNTGTLAASLTTINLTGTLWRTSVDGAGLFTTQVIGANTYHVFTNKRFVATTQYVLCDDPYVRFDHCSFTASGLINNTSAMVQASSACNAGIFDDCTFDGGAAFHNRGVQFDHGDITVLRGNFTRTGNAAVEKNDTTGLWSVYVTDSYIHEVKGWPPADHADGLQMGAGKNFTAQHNTIWVEPFNATDGDTSNVSNSCIGLWAELGNVTGNVLINNNQMAGGGSVMYVEQKAGFVFQGSVTVSNNVFVRNHFSSLQGAPYNPTTGHAAIWYTLAPPGRPASLSGVGSGWSNNTWEDGTIVTLNDAVNPGVPAAGVPRLRNPAMGGVI